jgi:hypothetical protein
MNGYMVRVGCQTLVFQTTESLLSELGAYLRDPANTEKQYVHRYPMQAGEDVPAMADAAWNHNDRAISFEPEGGPVVSYYAQQAGHAQQTTAGPVNPTRRQ